MEVKMAGMAVIAALAATSLFLPKGALSEKGSLRPRLKIVKKKPIFIPVEKSIEVNVPAIVAYRQWTEFEDLPQFLTWIKKVRHVDESNLSWEGFVGDTLKEWKTEITQLITGERISWRSVGDIECAGVVTFLPVTNTTTWVTIQMQYPQKNDSDSLSDVFKVNSKRLSQDLKNYKAYAESQEINNQLKRSNKWQLCAVNA